MTKSVLEIDQPTQQVIEEFVLLAKIPRKSGHEDAISAYLYQWAKDRGFAVEKDPENNVIIDKPGSKGKEGRPRTILQAHMDMVCVGAEGYAYDPLHDPIIVINDGMNLRAQGTSLGADDGIGVAMAQYILCADLACGPLRVIFTVNEEELMWGAEKINKNYLDAAYLINLDSEDDHVLTNSSAGGMTIKLKKQPTIVKAQNDRVFCLTISGLLGGHSGVDINKGRLNAIRAMGYTLLALSQKDVDYELVSINGGTADNVIPNKCSAEIVIKSADQAQLELVLAEIKKLIWDAYGYEEKNMQFVCEPMATMPNKVLSALDAEHIVTLITQITNGVQTMSSMVEGLVQSSSNIGIVAAEGSAIDLTVYWRSSDELFIEQLYAKNLALAKICNMAVEIKTRAPGWPINPESKLKPLVTAIYKEQNAKEMDVEAIHAGLECSWFYAKNPKLDMISVGPNVTGAHSSAETLEIASLRKTLNLVIETLKSLG